MSSREEVIRIFLAENQENLDHVEGDLIALEKDPSAKDRVGRIFRCVHSLKGTCGFLGFKVLEELSHAGEGLLASLRDGRIPLTPPVSNAVLAVVDAARRILKEIEKTGQEGAPDIRKAMDEIARAQVPQAVTVAPQTPAEPAPPDAAQAPAAPSKVRLDVGLLDRIMNLVGELVLSRNRLTQAVGAVRDPALHQAVQGLQAVTSELQERVLKTRMQPVGSVWDRFPRIVRDLSLACQKKVRLEMQGEETELDRAVIEAIGEPMVHLLRNAVDHGLETPEKRRAAGKTEEGLIRVSALQEGGQVILEFFDDGQGIHTNHLRARALKARLITPEQATQMTEQEAQHLIFLPGLSTAAKVTHISGRGVGMDVVRANIEKLGGSIEVQSRRGIGTLLRIRIPLTLAIIPALVVLSGGERFAVPQLNLLELVRLQEGEAAAEIENLHAAPVYRLRGKLLPLVFLDRLLGLAGAPAGGTRTLVVLQADDHPFGLVVERVLDTEDIVVKPLGPHLQGLEVYAGATLLGDGRMGLILDVGGVARRSGVLARSRERGLAAPTPAAAAPAAGARESLLLVRGKDDGRLAIPLGEVTRLEVIESAQVERAGGRELVQYRGEILPLLRLRNVLPERRTKSRAEAEEPEPPRLHVVVTRSQGRNVGLVVDLIIDIVEESAEAARPASRPGVSRCAVIRERVTEVLDLEGLLQAAGDLTP